MIILTKNQPAMKRIITLVALSVIFTCCTGPVSEPATDTEPADMPSLREYHTINNPGKVQDGNISLIPIRTPLGEFRVWTKRTGNNPDMKLLFLHGGPGFSHDYFECADSFLPQEGIEYYYYDQLGSAYSDQPSDTSLWNIDRFVEEVEQVRKALDLGPDNFYILGHSWGGILAIEYALKYQQNVKGLIISNMMSSVPDYNRYAREVLGPMLPADVLEEIRKYEAAGDYENERYLELITTHYYPEHVLRIPMEQYPDPVNRAFAKFNPEVYVYMQGPSEFGITEEATLHSWDRSADLSKINVPTLVIGAQHDTMDPEHMEWMATQFPEGEYLYCENGSHLSMYDDQQTYFSGLINFIKSVNEKQDGIE